MTACISTVEVLQDSYLQLTHFAKSHPFLFLPLSFLPFPPSSTRSPSLGSLDHRLEAVSLLSSVGR